MLRYSIHALRRRLEGSGWLFLLFFAWPAVLVSNSGPSMVDSMLLGAIRLVDDGTLTLSDGTDPELVFLTRAFDISVHEGRIYSGVGPGASVIAAPFYALFKPLFALFDEGVVTNKRVTSYYRRNGRALEVDPPEHFKDAYLLQILMVWVFVVPLFASFLVRLYARMSARGSGHTVALVVVVAVGWGSMALYYSTMYSRQALAYLFVWHALLSLWRPRSTGSPSSGVSLLAGGLMGTAVAIDYPAALLVGLSLLFLLRRLPVGRAVLVLAPCVAALSLLALYHHVAFGSPFTTPYQKRFWVGSSVAAERGLLDFEEGRRPTANPPSPAVMLRLCFGYYKGLFVYSPVLLMGALGHFRGLRNGRDKARSGFCLLVFLVYLTFNSTLGTHVPEYGHHFWGGLSMLWGPRHLFAVLPFLAVGIASLDWSRAWTRFACYGLLVVSCLFNFLGPMFSHVMLSTYAFGPELRVPVAYGLQLLLELGPRVPLLDVSGVRPGAQAAVVGFVAFLSVVCLLRPGANDGDDGASTPR